MLKYNYFSNNCHFLPKKVINCQFFVIRLYAKAGKRFHSDLVFFHLFPLSAVENSFLSTANC